MCEWRVRMGVCVSRRNRHGRGFDPAWSDPRLGAAFKTHIGTGVRRPVDAPGRGIRATVGRVNAADNARPGRGFAGDVGESDGARGIVVDAGNASSTMRRGWRSPGNRGMSAGQSYRPTATRRRTGSLADTSAPCFRRLPASPGSRRMSWTIPRPGVRRNGRQRTTSSIAVTGGLPVTRADAGGLVRSGGGGRVTMLPALARLPRGARRSTHLLRQRGTGARTRPSAAPGALCLAVRSKAPAGGIP